MKELYEAVLAATKTAVKKEKDKGFSNTTFRMINQACKMYQCLYSLSPASSFSFRDDKESEEARAWGELPPIITAE